MGWMRVGLRVRVTSAARPAISLRVSEKKTSHASGTSSRSRSYRSHINSKPGRCSRARSLGDGTTSKKKNGPPADGRQSINRATSKHLQNSPRSQCCTRTHCLWVRVGVTNGSWSQASLRVGTQRPPLSSQSHPCRTQPCPWVLHTQRHLSPKVPGQHAWMRTAKSNRRRTVVMAYGGSPLCRAKTTV